jgi:hypothetical protein
MPTSPLDRARCTVLGTRRARLAGDVGTVVHSGSITADVAGVGTACRHQIAVVVSGRIEHRSSIEKRLRSEGHTLRSDSDAELVAHLVERVRGLVPDLALAVQVASLELGTGWAAVVAEEASDPTVVVSEGPLLVVNEDIPVAPGDVVELGPPTRWWHRGHPIPSPAPLEKTHDELPLPLAPLRLADVA